MWSAPIHNKEFVGEMLEHVQEHASEFGTSSRIEGMLTIAKQVSRPPLLTQNWLTLYSDA